MSNGRDAGEGRGGVCASWRSDTAVIRPEDSAGKSELRLVGPEGKAVGESKVEKGERDGCLEEEPSNREEEGSAI